MEYKSNSNFLFTTCQVGAEKALKKEVLREHPEFKFAFSRPGFLTFKSPTAVPFDFILNSVFARTYGVSFSTIQVVDQPQADLPLIDQKSFLNLPIEFKTKLDEFMSSLRKIENTTIKKRLHVWERDFYAPGEEPKGYIFGSRIQNLDFLIRKESGLETVSSGQLRTIVQNKAGQNLEPISLAKGPPRPDESLDFFEESAEAKDGDFVVDAILIDPNRYCLGGHIHSNSHSPWPGGRPTFILNPDAPSRAYLKLEECLLWSKAPLRSGDLAVEIGSAPGGASFALLERGLMVVGVDPGEMAPQVLAHQNFRHFKKVVNDVLREDFPNSVQWFLLDMNVEPRVSLFAVDRLVSRMKESLLGVLLTVKLNQWAMADQIPDMLEHVKAMGMVKVKAAQLAHHRQEIIIYGLTKKGMTRLNQKPKISRRRIVR